VSKGEIPRRPLAGILAGRHGRRRRGQAKGRFLLWFSRSLGCTSNAHPPTLRAPDDILTFVSLDDEIITTGEAARLTGRSQNIFRWAVSQGTLSTAGRTELGSLLLRTSDVLEWHKNHRRLTITGSKPWNAAADGLAVLGAATAEELAAYLGIHPGNARKYLLILQAQARAERAADGQWSLLPSTAGAA
jgi:hypothetical protein